MNRDDTSADDDNQLGPDVVDNVNLLDQYLAAQESAVPFPQPQSSPIHTELYEVANTWQMASQYASGSSTSLPTCRQAGTLHQPNQPVLLPGRPCASQPHAAYQFYNSASIDSDENRNRKPSSRCDYISHGFAADAENAIYCSSAPASATGNAANPVCGAVIGASSMAHYPVKHDVSDSEDGSPPYFRQYSASGFSMTPAPSYAQHMAAVLSGDNPYGVTSSNHVTVAPMMPPLAGSGCGYSPSCEYGAHSGGTLVPWASYHS